MPDISFRKIYYYGYRIRQVKMFTISSMYIGTELHKEEKKRHLGHPGVDGRKILEFSSKK
jgi:hypothetical protein